MNFWTYRREDCLPFAREEVDGVSAHAVKAVVAGYIFFEDAHGVGTAGAGEDFDGCNLSGCGSCKGSKDDGGECELHDCVSGNS